MSLLQLTIIYNFNSGGEITVKEIKNKKIVGVSSTIDQQEQLKIKIWTNNQSNLKE